MKKGFTLVELLAVIVILSVIAIITVPIIGNVIEESKKKALEQSAYGLVEAANYLALSSNELEHFTFTENGVESITENKLDYKGKIDATGDLYIDEEGDISLCLYNDKYYVYKNYGMNDEVIVGEKKDGNCIAGHDILTNKYVAMLDNGTGQVSNVYSKDEVDGLISALSNTYATKEYVDEQDGALSTMIGTDTLTTTAQTLTGAINELDAEIEVQTYTSTDNNYTIKKYGKMCQLSINGRSARSGMEVNDYAYITEAKFRPVLDSIVVIPISNWNVSSQVWVISGYGSLNVRPNGVVRIYIATASGSATGTLAYVCPNE